MSRNKTKSAIPLALALAALPLIATTAFAGSVQGAQTYYGAASQGANLYAPMGIGNITNNTQMNYAPGNGGSMGFSGMSGMGGNVNVQTNIDNTKVINSTNNISVTQTINGSNVAYGLDGANALDVINTANSDGAAVHAQFAGPASDIESEALAVAQSMGY